MIRQLHSYHAFKKLVSNLSKFVFLLFVCLFCFSPCFLANNKNAIFIEGLGVGGYGSINFERRILNKNIHQIHARIGFGTYNITDFTNSINPDVILPIGINYCIGKQHKLSSEIGLTYSSIVQLNPNSFEPKRENNFSPYIGLGYKFNKVNSRFFGGAVYYRKFEFFEYPRNWAGFFIGYILTKDKA